MKTPFFNDLYILLKLYPDKPWNWREIAKNPCITWDIVKEYHVDHWNWYFLSQNPNVTWDIVEQNPELSWNWYGLSLNPSISLKTALKFCNKPWSWEELHAKREHGDECLHVEPDDINLNVDNSDFFYWLRLSQSSNVTRDYVKANVDKGWDWHDLSKNACIIWENIRDNPDIPWNWCGVSQNPNVTWDIVQRHEDMPWNIFGLSRNPNITWKIVRDSVDKGWDWFGLSQNTFGRRERWIKRIVANSFRLWKIKTKEVICRRKELARIVSTMVYYMPGAKGYKKAQSHFARRSGQ